MKRIISIIVLTAMFTAIAVGLAGCGVKTTLRSGNDPIIASGNVMKPMMRILIGLKGYIMALISTRADGE